MQLEDWNADMAEQDVGKISQADRKCGPEEDLYSSVITAREMAGQRKPRWSELGTTTERTNLALRTEALRVVSARTCSELSDLVLQRRKTEATRRATRHVERTIPSSKHGVKSNCLNADTGPHPSR